MDLHSPFDPLCKTTTSVLTSMTDGGRGGFDAPYIPRGCDLRFYTTSEICSILSRYEAIVIFGDSLMRHLTSALSMLLRENYEYGGQQQWLHGAEHEGCKCDGQTQLLFCHQADVRNLQDVYDNDPNSIACPSTAKPNIHFQALNKWPLDAEELDNNINMALSGSRPARPYAFIFGHGLWNEMHQWESVAWIDQLQSRVAELRPYYGQSDVFWPRLFITPNAAGEEKSDSYQLTQGNKAVVKFEKFMRLHAPDRNLDFFGTYNMSVQGTIPDGTHSGVRINLLKAMTLLNWLDLLDDDLWYDPTKQPEHGRNALGDRIPTAGNVSELTKALEEEKNKGLESEATEINAKSPTEEGGDDVVEVEVDASLADATVADQQILAQDTSQELQRTSSTEDPTSDQEVVIEEVFEAD
ncbi:MAG: hypothetical protein M1828_004693 [Chrysothrix sp. TS-e1954]|nr:MAG: hypothetical protein M1828_004693 [Chrysothrix sp. TS-e1954]